MKRTTFFQFASPSIVVMTFLMVIPLIMAIYLGMHFITYNNLTEPQFIGMRNYAEVLGDPVFWRSFRFTGLYALIVVPTQLVVGFVVALLLDQVPKFLRGVFLSFFLLPFIVVPVVGTTMLKQLFEASGLFAWVLREFFQHKFLYTEFSVKTLIILNGIWQYAPFSLVTYFAGFQTLSKDLLEAASIDGASRWQKIRYVVIPHVRSLTIFILLFSIMDAYRVFDSVYVMSGLNPLFKAGTVMTYTFQTAVALARHGKANAMAVLTVIGILIILIPNLIMSYREQIQER